MSCLKIHKRILYHLCFANTNSHFRTRLHPHELATAPFPVMGMDFLGAITPISTCGNSYIMAITDFVSKWAEVSALPDTSAQTTFDAFYRLIVQRHGLPKAIVSDRGSNFTSTLFRSFCRTFNIEQPLTTFYNPASNGETERLGTTPAPGIPLCALLLPLISPTRPISSDLLDDGRWCPLWTPRAPSAFTQHTPRSSVYKTRLICNNQAVCAVGRNRQYSHNVIRLSRQY